MKKRAKSLDNEEAFWKKISEMSLESAWDETDGRFYALESNRQKTGRVQNRNAKMQVKIIGLKKG